MSAELALLAAMEANPPVQAGYERRIWKDAISSDVKVKPLKSTKARDDLVIYLRFHDGLTYEEIGSRIGIKEDSVKRLFQRLRRSGILEGYEK